MMYKMFFRVRGLVTIIAAFCVVLSCARSAKSPDSDIDKIVYHLPEAGRMYIYESDGIVVFDTSIESSSVNSGGFVLPSNFFTDGFTMYQSGKRLYTYSMEKANVLVERNENDKKTIQNEDVTKVYVPDIIPDVPVDIKYSIQYKDNHADAISWEMVLDIQMQENNMLECGVFTRVDSEISLPPMDAFLATKKGVIIPVGKLRIAPHKIDFIKIETATMPYQLIYEWDTEQEDAVEYMYAENPFLTRMDSVHRTITQNGLSKYSGNRKRFMTLIPDKPFQIYTDEHPGIKTDRRSVVSEHKERKDLPFTHSLRYTAQNTMPEKIMLLIDVPVTYGSAHKTQYHFKKEPDARPGDIMQWKFELESGATALVEFTFDTDIKDVYSYRQYDYSDGGR